MSYRIEQDGIKVTVDTFVELSVALVVLRHGNCAIESEMWDRLRMIDRRERLIREATE